MAETTELINASAEVEALKAEIEAKDKIIEALKVELSTTKAEAAKPQTIPTVKVGKDTYEVVIPRFQFEGETYTAADVVKNEKLAATLVKEQASVLVKKQS